MILLRKAAVCECIVEGAHARLTIWEDGRMEYARPSYEPPLIIDPAPGDIRLTFESALTWRHPRPGSLAFFDAVLEQARRLFGPEWGEE